MSEAKTNYPCSAHKDRCLPTCVYRKTDKRIREAQEQSRVRKLLKEIASR